MMVWTPPGKNCGLCGSKSCEEFTNLVHAGMKKNQDCPFYGNTFPTAARADLSVNYTGTDICGAPYDFVLTPLPGEPSARKIVLPFRPDLVEREGIVKGDIVLGRPAGAGCPVQHVIRVIEADPLTGLITGHVVGPAFSRNNPDVIDVKLYHMIGFEGLADVITRAPEFGIRHPFLPGFCMMHRTHTGLVNLVMQQSYGIHVRIEGIVIL